MQTLPATEVTHKLVCRLLFMSGRRTLNPYSSKLDKKPKNATPLPVYIYILQMKQRQTATKRAQLEIHLTQRDANLKPTDKSVGCSVPNTHSPSAAPPLLPPAPGRRSSPLHRYCTKTKHCGSCLGNTPAWRGWRTAGAVHTAARWCRWPRSELD
jgi:hypothetical protein